MLSTAVTHELFDQTPACHHSVKSKPHHTGKRRRPHRTDDTAYVIISFQVNTYSTMKMKFYLVIIFISFLYSEYQAYICVDDQHIPIPGYTASNPSLISVAPYIGSNPVVGFISNDAYISVWSGTDYPGFTGYSVIFAIMNINGSMANTLKRINSDPEQQTKPSIAISNSKYQFGITWLATNNNTRILKTQMFHINGTAATSSVIISSTNLTRTLYAHDILAISENDLFIISECISAQGYLDIVGYLYDSSANLVTNITIISDNVDHYSPTAYLLNDGNIVAVYTTYTGNNEILYGKIINVFSNSIGGQFTITDPSKRSFYQKIISNNAGFTVSWSGSAFSPYISYRSFDNNGFAQTIIYTLTDSNCNGTRSVTNNQFITLNNTNFFLWSYSNINSSLSGQYLQMYNPQTSQFQGNIFYLGTQEYGCSVATYKAGFIVAWTESVSGTYYQIKTQNFYTLIQTTGKTEATGLSTTEGSTTNYISNNTVNTNENILTDSSSNNAALIGGIVGGIGFILLAVIILIVVYRKLTVAPTPLPIDIINMDSFGNNNHSTTLTKNELNQFNLELGEPIGEGNFGKVYKGVIKVNTQSFNVAVKALKNTGTLDELSKEIFIMTNLKHQNVVTFFGVSEYKFQDHNANIIITELMELGSLDTFLKHYGKSVKPLDITSFAIDAATGIRYLHENNIIHRDLGARNLLITEDKNNKGKYLVKVSDFGLSRQLASKQENYAVKSGNPIRWSAPESLLFGQANFKSDIWSFGVVLYELFTVCELPYKELDNYQVYGKIQAKEKMFKYLPIPDCPDGIEKLLTDCMDNSPQNRPDFNKIIQLLEGIKSEIEKKNEWNMRAYGVIID